MRIAAISDIHLGSGGRTDRFGHSDAAFLRFLDHLEGRYDQVVLLGDIFDAHHGWIPLAHARELAEVRREHRDVAERLLSGRYPVVAGNHDDVLLELGLGMAEFVAEAGSHKALFLHGHQYDRLILASPRLCAVGNYLAGMADRFHMQWGLALADAIDDRANQGRESREERYRREARDLCRRRGVDVVIMGHTHQQDGQSGAGWAYVNTGTCIQGRFQGAAVDVSKGTATTFALDPNAFRG